MSLGTIYSATDKSMFDALNQKTVTNGDLRELFLSRGILVSKETTRVELAKHFVRLNHDYYDYQKLATLFGGRISRDRMSSVRIVQVVAFETFESAAHELKANLEAEGATVKVTSKSDGSRIDIEVHYQAIHFNKSEFRQVVNRSSLISIENSVDGLSIHSPFTDESNGWVAALAHNAGVIGNVAITLEEIRLPLAFSLEHKSEFFRRLIKSIEGFTFSDVSDVYVWKPEKSKSKALDEDELADQELGNTEIHIKKASLKGTGVLQSEELKLLSKEGFFISRIVWTSKLPTNDSDIYELEAQFSNPDECSGFSFLPRGLYKYKNPGNYNETRTGLSKDEDQRIGRLIESAARKTMKDMIGVSHA